MEFSHERDLKDIQTKHEKIHQSVGGSCSFRSAESTVSFVSLSLFLFFLFFVLTFISLKGECITHRVTQSSAKDFKRLKDEGRGGGRKPCYLSWLSVSLSFFRPVEIGFFLYWISTRTLGRRGWKRVKSFGPHISLSDGHGWLMMIQTAFFFFTRISQMCPVRRGTLQQQQNKIERRGGSKRLSICGEVGNGLENGQGGVGKSDWLFSFLRWQDCALFISRRK